MANDKQNKQEEETRTLTVWHDGREGCGVLKDGETVLAKFYPDTDMDELMKPYKGWEVVQAGEVRRSDVS